jgi:hypothetical protein
MSKKKGTVTGVGKGTYSYFIQIDTMDGFYFNTKYEPKCGKGDVVGIEYNKKDDKRGNVQKVTIIEKNSDGYKPTNTGGGGGGAGGGYKAEPGRQESIVYQSSRKDALAYLALLLENKGFTLKGAAGKIEEQLEQKLTQIIGEFYQDAMTPSKSPALVGVAEDEKEDKDDDSEFEDDDEKEDDFDDEWDD